VYFSALFVHACLSFHCSYLHAHLLVHCLYAHTCFHCRYSHARLLVRRLYTPASVSTVLTCTYFKCAVCTPLPQFPPSLFQCTSFIALIHPCLSFHCPYSRARILERCLYTPASVSTVLIYMHVFSALFVHPCLSFHRAYSHARLLVRCLYTPASVSTVLIHMNLF
jgi:hypothetical protein